MLNKGKEGAWIGVVDNDAGGACIGSAVCFVSGCFCVNSLFSLFSYYILSWLLNAYLTDCSVLLFQKEESENNEAVKRRGWTLRTQI